ncbi:PREDICTED: uncharacterized protein LOC109216128 [Nicotiana attenuata]|uniref:uncharacterized protein LOC109216128 n=1 Tax=Nicotiana attenuata TaxID=49451 RepID=UPI0009045DA8|nr:PREDICTED: uncharacterized protein LOC109216128 [Nicotiana attenuata]
MRQMPKVCANDSPSRRATPFCLVPVAIHEMGNGYCQPSSIGPRWVEEQAFEKVREKEVIDFIWDHIIYRFGMPFKTVCDNGKQFIGKKVTKFIEDCKIKKVLSTPYHPSGNEQAKSTNKTIIQNLMKRLTHAKGKWREILPEVLWAYRTTSKSSTRATPFSLVYGAEALILVEDGEPSIRF